MSEITVGSVSVEVVPDARRFPPKLARQVNPEAAKIGAEFGRLFGAAAEQQMARGVREGLDSGGKDTQAKGAKQGEQYGGGFARALKARLETALRSLPDIKLDADSSEADRKIAGIRENLAALQNKTVGVDLDAETARAQIRKLQTDLQDLTRGTKDIQVRADALAASNELRKIQAQIAEVSGKRVVIEVDADTAAASSQLALLNGQARGAGSGFAALLGAALLLGPALIPIAAVGAGAMAAIATGALAAAGGLGVLILALYPVIQAVQAIRQADDKSAAAARGATSAHLQMASAMDAVETAQRGLASAQEDARVATIRSAETIKTAERGVRDAERAAALDRAQDARRVGDAKLALADVARRAARDQEQADQQIADAERSLADAQRDVLDAQQALNDARAQAVRDAQELSQRVADGKLDERDATLRVQEAQERLAEVQADPTATDLQRQRAQLAVDQAVAGLQRQKAELADLARQEADSAQAGVDGSRVVQDAQEALIEASRREVEARNGVALATRAAAEQQQAAARDITDAQRDIADAVQAASERQRRDQQTVADANAKVGAAVRDAADQQRRSADSIVSAQQAVVAAQRGVQQASQAAGATGGAAMDTVREKLEALSPAGRRFVDFVNGTLLPAFGGLSKTAQEGFLPGLQAGLESLMPLVPQFKGFVSELATTLGGLARDAGKALTEPFWRDFFTFIGDTAGPLLETMGKTFGNVVTGIAGLIQAFFPTTEKFGDGILGLSQRFAEFGKGAGKNEGFQAFLAYINENGPKVVTAFGAIALAVGNILRSLAPLGPVILSIVTGFAQFIATLSPAQIVAITLSLGSLIAIFQTLTNVVRVVRAVAGAINIVKLAVGGLSKAFAFLAANPIVLIVAAIALLVFGLIEAYKHSETFRDIVDAVWAAVKDAISTAWEKIKGIWNAISTFITVALPEAFTKGVDALKSTWTSLKTHVSDIWNKIKDIFDKVWSYIKDAVAVFFEREIRGLKRIWTGLKTSISDTWDLISGIFDKVWSYVKDTVRALFQREIDGLANIWTGLRDTIESIWSGKFGIKTIFNALGNYVKDHVADLFAKGIAAIGKAWDGIKELAAAPIRFVIETVINKGIIGGFNKVADLIPKAPHLKEVELPEGLKPQKKATGGYISGPGGPRDDLIPALLSNGEYVINAASVANVGRDLLDFINRGGSIGGDLGGVARFASGGLVRDTIQWLPSVDPLPYRWGAVGPDAYDCSGLSSEVLNRITGRPSYHRNFTTASNLAQLGFAPGFGQFTLGVNPGSHMVGTLAGLGFEARSTATGIFVGPSATDPLKMKQQWYLTDLPGGKLDEGKGFNWGNPLAAVGDAFSGIFDSFPFEGPFADMVLAMPKALVSAAGDFLHDAIPGYADGGLVTKYDEGGYLPPGLTTVINKTGRPEPVLTSGQWASMRDGGGGGVTINQTNNYPTPEKPSVSLTRSLRTAARYGLLPQGAR